MLRMDVTPELTHLGTCVCVCVCRMGVGGEQKPLAAVSLQPVFPTEKIAENTSFPASLHAHQTCHSQVRA